jgi:hypothetical protein
MWQVPSPAWASVSTTRTLLAPWFSSRLLTCPGDLRRSQSGSHDEPGRFLQARLERGIWTEELLAGRQGPGASGAEEVEVVPVMDQKEFLVAGMPRLNHLEVGTADLPPQKVHESGIPVTPEGMAGAEVIALHLVAVGDGQCHVVTLGTGWIAVIQMGRPGPSGW